MKKICTLFLLVCLFTQLRAQENTRSDIFYTMSGFGFSFPVGETGDYMGAKFSNTLGANIGLGKSGGLFIYPKVNLHSYKFNQLVTEPGNPYLVKDGRSTTYIANINLGYRTTKGKMSYYGYLGGGGGIILTQKGNVNGPNNTVTLSNKSNGLGTMELGAGIEYKLGTFILFTEGSYLHGFSKLEDKPFNAIPLTVGFKTDLSKVFMKKS